MFTAAIHIDDVQRMNTSVILCFLSEYIPRLQVKGMNEWMNEWMTNKKKKEMQGNPSGWKNCIFLVLSSLTARQWAQKDSKPWAEEMAPCMQIWGLRFGSPETHLHAIRPQGSSCNSYCHWWRQRISRASYLAKLPASVNAGLGWETLSPWIRGMSL